LNSVIEGGDPVVGAIREDRGAAGEAILDPSTGAVSALVRTVGKQRATTDEVGGPAAVAKRQTIDEVKGVHVLFAVGRVDGVAVKDAEVLVEEVGEFDTATEGVLLRSVQETGGEDANSPTSVEALAGGVDDHILINNRAGDGETGEGPKGCN